MLVQSDYWIYMFTMVGIFMILVGSLDLAYGYTGLVSLAHAAFFGIGAYSSSILQVKLGTPIVPALIAGTLITACIAAVIGWPMLRIRGPYFVLGTLAIGIAVSIVIHKLGQADRRGKPVGDSHASYGSGHGVLDRFFLEGGFLLCDPGRSCADPVSDSPPDPFPNRPGLRIDTGK